MSRRAWGQGCATTVGMSGGGFGVELGGGVVWEIPRLGLSLDLAGRTLLAHEAHGRRERGFSAVFGYDARPESTHGLSLMLRQETGMRPGGGLDALFASGWLHELDGPDGGIGAERSGRWMAEAEYGVPIFGGGFTAGPTVEFDLSGGVHDYSFRLACRPDGGSLGFLSRPQGDPPAGRCRGTVAWDRSSSSGARW